MGCPLRSLKPPLHPMNQSSHTSLADDCEANSLPRLVSTLAKGEEFKLGREDPGENVTSRAAAALDFPSDSSSLNYGQPDFAPPLMSQFQILGTFSSFFLVDGGDKYLLCLLSLENESFSTRALASSPPLRSLNPPSIFSSPDALLSLVSSIFFSVSSFSTAELAFLTSLPPTSRSGATKDSESVASFLVGLQTESLPPSALTSSLTFLFFLPVEADFSEFVPIFATFPTSFLQSAAALSLTFLFFLPNVDSCLPEFVPASPTTLLFSSASASSLAFLFSLPDKDAGLPELALSLATSPSTFGILVSITCPIILSPSFPVSLSAEDSHPPRFQSQHLCPLAKFQQCFSVSFSDSIYRPTYLDIYAKGPGWVGQIYSLLVKNASLPQLDPEFWLVLHHSDRSSSPSNFWCHPQGLKLAVAHGRNDAGSNKAVENFSIPPSGTRSPSLIPVFTANDLPNPIKFSCGTQEQVIFKSTSLPTSSTASFTAFTKLFEMHSKDHISALATMDDS
ncbi:hypothetical protein SADUNF_Sadunf04G0090600 [Salix dunnii]|uniref:Uncharacterized protein n=1 Tax=Salix dunnii TaxID=1413687 RepID=A0A835KB87_9ROSI|nr:hypothetical protein SADUNF_Sadunf04G0090600 [Salix dunnii]